MSGPSTTAAAKDAEEWFAQGASAPLNVTALGVAVSAAAADTPRDDLHFSLDGGSRRLGQIAPHLCGMNSDFRMLGHAPREIV